MKRLSSGQFTRKMMPTCSRNIHFFFRTDFYNWYHPQWNSEDKKCENLLIARVRVSCQQKQWRNFVWVDDFLLLLGAGYLPVRVICWNFFLAIAKIDRCGKSAARVNGRKLQYNCSPFRKFWRIIKIVVAVSIQCQFEWCFM